MVYVQLKIKFRWLSDWGKFDRTFQCPIPGLPTIPPFDKVLFDERGVLLRVYGG